jgi:hypothetical protein
MKKTSILLSLILSSFNLTVAPSQAQSGDACDMAISKVAEQIYRYGTSVRIGFSNDANESHMGNPTDRDGTLQFVIGGWSLASTDEPNNYLISMVNNENDYNRSNSITSNIMLSSKLQEGWANYLVKHCNDIAVVKFEASYVNQGGCGWIVDFAIQSNGLTRQRDCISFGSGINSDYMTWNITVC